MSTAPFQLDLSLPPGALIVEASAGTGKTYNIARLVARVLVEREDDGREPPAIAQVLVVTFTEAATSELRDRVRAFLVEALAALEKIAAEGDGELPFDDGIAALAGVRDASGWTARPAEELTRRMAYLARAIRNFDTAPILTIHGFCQRVLRDLAFESGAAFDAELLTDTSPVLDELVDDWMAKTLVAADAEVVEWITEGMKLTRDRLREIARVSVSNRDARLLPDVPIDWRAVVALQRTSAKALRARIEAGEGKRLLDALKAANLNQRSYSPEKIALKCQELVDWLARGALADSEAAVPFTRAAVAKAATKKSAAVDDAVMDAIETFAKESAVTRARYEDGILEDFARWAQSEHHSRIGRAQQQTYDDLLHLVADGLTNEALVAGLRDRYRVALIDEFQDTDAVQWKIFHTIFPAVPAEDVQGHGKLLLIGDPKQAIYAFRGADVRVYASAREQVAMEHRYTMPRNFRSDAPLVTSLNALLGAAPNIFLDDKIGYLPVDAKFGASRLHDAWRKPIPPVEIRWFDAGIRRSHEMGKTLSNTDADKALPSVVASDVAETLRCGWVIGDEAEHSRPLVAGDIAVLTRTNASARAIHRALLATGVPAILASAGSVFATDEAGYLLQWLDTISGGSLERPARALVLSPLLGWTVRDLLVSREGDTGEEAQRLGMRWAAMLEWLSEQRRILDERGVAAAAEHFLYESPGDGEKSALLRIAALSDGERRLTNLRHLVELLHGAALTERLAPRALHGWLSDRRAEADLEDETALLRLESDADAVKVLTIHRSKGLEFPLVFLPSLADGRVIRGRDKVTQPIRFHPEDDARLHIDLRGFNSPVSGAGERAKREMLAENQRLLYVALTRARHRVVIYAGPLTGKDGANYAQSPLGLLLHGRGKGTRVENAEAAIAPELAKGGNPDLLRGQIEALAKETPGAVLVSCGTAGMPTFVGTADRVAKALTPLAIFPADRVIDRVWRRESYSGWVDDRKGELAAKEAVVDLRGGDDETGTEDAVPATASGTLSDPQDTAASGAEEVLWKDLPRGAAAGSWVHGVFEKLSFNAEASDKTREARPGLVRSMGERWGFGTSEHDALLLRGIPAILETPLGVAAEGVRLCDISDQDRLSEVKFDIAIGAGDDWDGNTLLQSRDLQRLLGRVPEHPVLPVDYFTFLAGFGLRPLAGFLTGSIDLVIRVPVEGGRKKWFLCDYKTNLLGPRAEASGIILRSCPEHYGQAWMANEVVRHNYYLQYVLYSVALHRYLQSRLGDDYDYDRDFGGALYLFVRGMVGAATACDAHGRVNGVFHDRPDKRLVEGLSALFANPAAVAR